MPDLTTGAPGSGCCEPNVDSDPRADGLLTPPAPRPPPPSPLVAPAPVLKLLLVAPPAYPRPAPALGLLLLLLLPTRTRFSGDRDWVSMMLPPSLPPPPPPLPRSPSSRIRGRPRLPPEPARPAEAPAAPAPSPRAGGPAASRRGLFVWEPQARTHARTHARKYVTTLRHRIGKIRTVNDGLRKKATTTTVAGIQTKTVVAYYYCSLTGARACQCPGLRSSPCEMWRARGRGPAAPTEQTKQHTWAEK
jgi:hypothetical protein